jgi:hypothetical protein
LVDAGANPSLRDKRWNSSAYAWANEDKQTHVMNYLKQNNLVDIFDAVEYNLIDAVKWCILNDPACVHAPDGLGIPIRIAAYFGHKEIAEILLQHGANPDLKSPDGKTSFDIANERGHKDFIPILEQHKNS